VDEAIKDAIMHEQSFIKAETLSRTLEERRVIGARLTKKQRATSRNAGSAKR
jgi:hypothetical protein